MLHQQSSNKYRMSHHNKVMIMSSLSYFMWDYTDHDLNYKFCVSDVASA